MNRIVILKSLATAALALGTLAAATTAHARDDVQFSITLGTLASMFNRLRSMRTPAPCMCSPGPYMRSRYRAMCIPALSTTRNRPLCTVVGATNANATTMAAT